MGTQRITIPPKANAGGFVRLVMSLANAKGDYMQAEQYALQWATGGEEVVRILRSAVSSGTTSDSGWASEVADVRRLSSEFCSLVRPRSIIGRLTGMRPVPFSTRSLREDAGATGRWVGEGLAAPVSKLNLDEVSLGHSKLSTIVVLTDELTRVWTPQSEAAVRGTLIKAVASALDVSFIDPTLSNVSDGPDSITSVATPLHSSGSSAAQIVSDLRLLVMELVDAGSDLSAASWVIHPRTALSLSTTTNTAGALAFPYVSLSGGSLLGLPVLVSAAVPIDTGDDTYVVLLDGNRILLADDDLALIDVSRQSSLQVDGNPTEADGSVAITSLWSSGLVGIKVLRWIRWEPVASDCAAVLDGVAY